MSRQDWCQPGIWERTDISELWKIFCIYRLANGGWIFFLTDPFTRQMEGSFVCIFSLFFPLALLRYNSQITLCKFKVYSRIIDTCIHCDSWGRKESDRTEWLIWSDLIHCEMITTVNLAHPSGSHNCHFVIVMAAAATAAKSLQSCPTWCDPIDSSPPGSPVPGILQARTLERVAISFSNAWKWKVKVKSLSHVRPSATPWTAAFQAPPSMGFSWQFSWQVGCHCLLRIVMARTFKTYSWSNFQVYNTILLVLIACWMLDFHDFNWKVVLFD